MTLLNEADPAARAPAAHGIRPATPADAPQIVTVLATAFADDPVFRWFIPDHDRRLAILPAFFAVFVDAFQARGETYVDAGHRGAALWSAPGEDPLGADPAYSERLTGILGHDADRMFEIVERFEAAAPAEPHAHLQFLGVRPDSQGLGLGGALMAPGLGRLDREGVPAYLEATSDRNRPLYERHHFRAQGDILLPGGPALWRMWREPAG